MRRAGDYPGLRDLTSDDGADLERRDARHVLETMCGHTKSIAETLRGDDWESAHEVLQAIERNTRTSSRDIRAVRGMLALIVLVNLLGLAWLVFGGL
jgi:hypothetical protein